MSKRYNDQDYTKFLRFFNVDTPLDEDMDDDDYNVVEDILTNKYNEDEDIYYLSIPKKEVKDINNDMFQYDPFFHNEELQNSQFNLSRNYRNSLLAVNNNNNNNSSINVNENREEIKESDTKEKDGCNINVNRKEMNRLEKRRKRREKRKNLQKKNERKIHINDNVNNVNYNNKNKLEENENDKKDEEKKEETKSRMMSIDGTQSNKLNSKQTETNKLFDDVNIGIPEENKVLNQMDICENLLFLLKQYDLALQLLIQNLMMVENKDFKHRCYCVLFFFYVQRQKVIENLKFPFFDIKFNFNQIFTESKPMQMRLQLSFFQPPILDILSILLKFIRKKTFTKEETTKILREFFPFINPLYLPITNKFKHPSNNTILSTAFKTNQTSIPNNEQNNIINNNNINIGEESTTFLKRKVRRKFDSISDNLLLIGLKTHGKKNIDAIQQLWLPSRTVDEIKHRIKNLTCQSAPENIIKKSKRLNETLLPSNEFLIFLKGIAWFGCKNKWHVISRYFLPERSSDYLEELFQILIEKKILPIELEGNSNCGNGFSSSNNPYSPNYGDLRKMKKRNIEVKEEVLQEYKNLYQKEIDGIVKEIGDVNKKNTFYTPEDIYEHFEIPSKVKKDNCDNHHINTRNKSNHYNNANGSGNGNNGQVNNFSNHKIKNYGFDFQIANAEEGTYEKITI